MSVFEGIQLPKVIYEAESKFNEKILVIDRGNTRKLSVGGIVQSVNWTSPLVNKMVWGSVVDVLKENLPSLGSVLVLGLGGGTVQHLISKTFPNVKIVSVEIDPVMVDVAKKFFDVENIPNHRIIVDDACRVITSPNEFGIEDHSFEALIVDIYCGEKYPELGKSGTFIGGLSNIVVPGGFVLFNRIYLESHQDEVNNFINIVEEYFADVKSLVIAGKTNSDNVLVFGWTK